MRTRFYKVTITDGHLTKCVVIPAYTLSLHDALPIYRKSVV